MQFVIRPQVLISSLPFYRKARNLLNPYKHFNPILEDFIERSWDSWAFYYIDTDKKRYSHHDVSSYGNHQAQTVRDAYKNSSSTFHLPQGVEVSGRDFPGSEFDLSKTYRSPTSFEELIEFLEGGESVVRRF